MTFVKKGLLILWFVTINSYGSKFHFQSREKKIVESMVNFQLVLTNIFLRALSNRHENPAFKNFILSEILLCLADLGRR